METKKVKEREALETLQSEVLCKDIGRSANDWLGIVESVTSEPGKKGYITIKVTDTLTIMTWSVSIWMLSVKMHGALRCDLGALNQE